MKIQLRVKIRALPSDSNWAIFLLFRHSMLTVTNVASSVKLLQVYYSMHQLCLQHIDSDAKRCMDHCYSWELQVIILIDSEINAKKTCKLRWFQSFPCQHMGIYWITTFIIGHGLWLPYGIGQAIIFLSCSFFFFLSSFFPRLFSAVRDWMSSILPHMMWP